MVLDPKGIETGDVGHYDGPLFISRGDKMYIAVTQYYGEATVYEAKPLPTQEKDETV